MAKPNAEDASMDEVQKRLMFEDEYVSLSLCLSLDLQFHYHSRTKCSRAEICKQIKLLMRVGAKLVS